MCHKESLQRNIGGRLGSKQIIRRAEAARARALRGLLGAILRGLRTATWASFAAAGNWSRAYIRRRERNAAVHELHALDDRTLGPIPESSSAWLLAPRS